MRQPLVSVVLRLAPIFLVVNVVEAQTLLGSARQTPEGSAHGTAYYRSLEDSKLVFDVGSGAFANEVAADVDGGWAGVKLAYQPWDSVTYSVTLGGGHLALDVSSVTVKNRYSGDRIGWLAGAGVKVSLVPETPVTPAVALGLAAERQSAQFGSLKQGGVTTAVKQRLTVDRYEAALWAAKRFGKLEPYGGVVWTRSRARLKDLANGARSGGVKDAAAPVIGLKLKLFPEESALLEARATMSGWVWQAAWEARFGKN